MKDGQREERKKDEQRGKWKRPSCLAAVPASQLFPPLPVSATCAGAHLAAAGPVIPRPPQHNLLRCCHRQDSSTPSPLALPLVPWFSPPTSMLSLTSGLALPRVASQSRLSDLSYLQSVQYKVRPVSLMTLYNILAAVINLYHHNLYNWSL